MADMSLAAGAMPFNLDAEQSVLGSVLMDSECMEGLWRKLLPTVSISLSTVQYSAQ